MIFVCFDYILVVLLAISPAIKGAATDDDHPKWTGTWIGSLYNFPSKDGLPLVDVKLEIGPFPLTDNSCTMWRTTYSKDNKVQQVKDYRLCRGNGVADLAMDEGDGLKLAMQWIGGVLVTPFKYDNLLLISTMRLREEILEEEILTMNDVSGTSGVQSMRAHGIQRVVLKRVKLE